MNNSEKKSFLVKISNSFLEIFPYASKDVAFFVACQFALESNFGQSFLAKKYNNFIGMKIPNFRLTVSVAPAGSTFAQYDSFLSCLHDYILWLSYNRFNIFCLTNLEFFKVKLQECGYCPDSDYIDKINNLFNQFKS